MTKEMDLALPETQEAELRSFEPTANDLVREFQEVFGACATPELRRKLIREETAEVAEAVEHLLKEFCDLIYVIEGAQIEGMPLSDLEPETLKNISTLFLLYGKIFPDHVIREAFKRVHASNMSKLVDGKPLRREDGKILKGPNYALPTLIDLI